jgi:hypothetical protein
LTERLCLPKQASLTRALVKEFLRQKSIETTMLYIQLEKAIFKGQDDHFIVKAPMTTMKSPVCSR